MTDTAIKIVGTFEIAKLRLDPADVLVIKTDNPVSRDVADRIRAHLKQVLPPDVKVLVINPGIEISVLTRGEIEARTA